MSLLDDVADEVLSKKDVTEASIVVLAYVINHEHELKRYHRWVMQSGAIDEALSVEEYRAHLEMVLAYLLRDYEEIRTLLGTADQIGAQNARMSSGVASGPSRVPSHGKESRKKGTDARLTGRRDDAYLFVV